MSEWYKRGSVYVPEKLFIHLEENCDWMVVSPPVFMLKDIDILKNVIEKFNNYGGLKIG